MNVLYFASLREAIGRSNEKIECAPDLSVGQLKTRLMEKYGAHHFASNILCAVNHELAENATMLNENDEVAFYPPVTGG